MSDESEGRRAGGGLALVQPSVQLSGARSDVQDDDVQLVSSYGQTSYWALAA